MWKSLDQKKEQGTSYNILGKNYNPYPHFNPTCWSLPSKPSFKMPRGTWHFLWRGTNIKRGNKTKKTRRAIPSVKKTVYPRMTWRYAPQVRLKVNPLILSEMLFIKRREWNKTKYSSQSNLHTSHTKTSTLVEFGSSSRKRIKTD